EEPLDRCSHAGISSRDGACITGAHGLETGLLEVEPDQPGARPRAFAGAAWQRPHSQTERERKRARGHPPLFGRPARLARAADLTAAPQHRGPPAVEQMEKAQAARIW